MKANPVIAVPVNTSWVNVYGSLVRQVTALGNAMIEPIHEAGGTPVLLSPMTPIAHIPDLLRSVDGIFLPGGPDLATSSYGERSRIEYSPNALATGRPYLRPMMMAPDVVRDEFEIALYRAGRESGVPILGICRGMQLINVAEGGTLHQEIDDVSTLAHELDINGYSHHHPVALREGSRVRSLIGDAHCVSPSMHHQAVNRLGHNLAVSGLAPDGVIEMIEHSDPAAFVVGVQGDIERARRNWKGFERIYALFIEECGRGRINGDGKTQGLRHRGGDVGAGRDQGAPR